MDKQKANVLIIGNNDFDLSPTNIFFEKEMEKLLSKADKAASLTEAQTLYYLYIYNLFIINCGENASELRQQIRDQGITAPLVLLVEEPQSAAKLAETIGDEDILFLPVNCLTQELFYLLLRYERLHYRNREMRRQLARRIADAEANKGAASEQSLFRDPLTGLYNRAYFLDRLSQLNTAHHRPLSLILGDMDGLALVNDAFGYQEGDRLLREVARSLESCCGSEDITARWSGDAFAVLLPNRSYRETSAVITCIKNALAKVKADPVGPSVSFGYATQADSSQDIHDVLQTAEMEMHRKKMSEGKDFCDTIIASLVNALGKKDYETEEHTWRMQNLAFKLGGAFGLDDNQFEELVLAVTLHDVGKIAVPEHILMKPGALTDEEWEIIKGHSERGYRIALCSGELAHSAPYILSHHERWDGKGYPQGLRQDDIPLISRIISVIDSYDVMVNGRPYKKGMTQEEAIAELKRCAGSQFDPRLVEMFIGVLRAQDNGKL